MLRKIIFTTTIFTIVSFNMHAQDYLGLSTGNYGGIQGVLLQPANVADNRYQYEINLLSGSLNFSNNYLGISRDYFFRNKFSFKGFESYQDFRSKVLTKDDGINEKVYLNIANRIQLPSLLLSTGARSGIALNFQSRTGIAVRNLDVALANQIYNTWDDNSTYGQNYNAGGLDVSGMNWLELGLTYGRVLINEDEHFLKAGVTAKYLGGISSMYFGADRLTARAENDSILYLQSDQIRYGHSPTNISGGINGSFRPDASTFGFDLGIVYEFRGRIDRFKFLKYNEETERLSVAKRRDKNKYTFKVGVSLLDLGQFRFRSVPLARDFAIDSRINLNAIDVRSIQDFDQEVKKRGNYVSDSASKYTVALPTAFSAQVDVHLYKGFYLNAMMYKPVSAFNYNADVRVYTPDYYAVTPRWESRVAGIYLPFVLSSKNELSAGATIRVGPVFFGTSNLLSFIEKDNIKAADIHAGLKIPIAFRKPGKSSALLRKIIADDDDDNDLDKGMPDETLFLKDTAATSVAKDSIQLKGPEQKPQQQPKVPVPQAPGQPPINIIINNYNSPNSAIPSNSKIYKLDSMNNVVPIDNMMQSTPAPADTQPGQLDLLQQQIDELNRKLGQKEMLLKELERRRTGTDSSGSDTEIKKKIPLTNNAGPANIVPDTGYNPYRQGSLAGQEAQQRLYEMKAMLDILIAKNDLLDRQLEQSLLREQLTPVRVQKKDSLRSAPDVAEHRDNKTATAEDNIEKTKSTLSDSLYYIKSLQLQEENERLKSQLDDVQKNGTGNVTQPASGSLFTGSNEFQGPAAKQEDIDKLTNEIISLKQKIADFESSNKSAEVIVRQKSPLVPNVMPTVGIGLGGNKTSVIHDTVYVNKPVMADTIVKYQTDTLVRVVRDTIWQRDTVVNKVRDTVLNTIVRDSIITKIKVVDSLKHNLLSMPPLVVLFDVGRYNLKMIYQKRLDYYAAQVRKTPGLIIAITGHTDHTGSAAQNLILSQKRAAAVSGYLLSKGLDRKQITETAAGEETPVADNQTSAGKSQNRRVEVMFRETKP